MKLNKVHRQLLKLCSDDYVGLWFAMTPIEDTSKGADPMEVRSKTIRILYELLREGLIQAGFPTTDGRDFEPWSISVDEAIECINREWDALGREPSIGDIVWFATTEKGERELRRLNSNNQKTKSYGGSIIPFKKREN
jgi:hypothetical protein